MPLLYRQAEFETAALCTFSHHLHAFSLAVQQQRHLHMTEADLMGGRILARAPMKKRFQDLKRINLIE